MVFANTRLVLTYLCTCPKSCSFSRQVWEVKERRRVVGGRVAHMVCHTPSGAPTAQFGLVLACVVGQEASCDTYNMRIIIPLLEFRT